MSVARFREPKGVPMEYWDLADERGPFFAYGGPVAYWRQIKDCKGKDRDLNWHVAKAMAATTPDKWRQMQVVAVATMDAGS